MVDALRLSRSHAFHNKAINPGTSEGWAHSRSFLPVTESRETFVENTLAGLSFVGGIFADNHRQGDQFQRAHVVALDYDNGVSVAQLVAVPFVRQYAMMVYPTPSSSEALRKSRLVFALDGWLDTTGRYAAAAAAIANEIPFEIDRASLSAVQAWRGSTNTSEPPYINLDATLPLKLVGSLTVESAEADYLESTRVIERAPYDPSWGVNAPYSRAVFENIVDEIARATDGTGRHNTTISKAAALMCRAHGRGWAFGVNEATNAIRYAVTVNGWAEAHGGEKAITRLIRDRIKFGAAHPIDAPAPRTNAPKATLPHAHDAPAGNGGALLPRAAGWSPSDASTVIRVNARYVSDIDLDPIPATGAIILRSDMGTGKSRFSARMIARLAQRLGRMPRILAVFPSRTLTNSFVQRNPELEMESYYGLEAVDLRRIDRLAICQNSLFKLIDPQTHALPDYDVILLDEINGNMAHLNGGTYKGAEGIKNHARLKALVKRAALVIAMDAHAGEMAHEWLKNVRGALPCHVVNEYTPERGALVTHDDHTTVIARANALIDQGEGVVVIPTNSRTLARTLESYYTVRLGVSSVKAIYQDNSESRESQEFIAAINEQIGSLKVFIYSPSIPSGVDIQARVRAVCGVFYAQPLDAGGIHQMIGRCRNADETHVYVQSVNGHAETSVESIYAQHVQNAIATGAVCDFDADGVIAVNDTQRGFLRLCAMTEAARARSMNALHDDFIRLAHGYIHTTQTGKIDAIHAELKAAREALSAADKALTLTAKPIDHDELDELRQRGEITPEARAGHDRYKIENTVGMSITPTLYDDLHKTAGREAVRGFTDLFDDPDQLKAADRDQATDGIPLNRRKHRLVRRTLRERLITDVFGATGLDSADALTGEDIAARMSNYLTLHMTDLRRMFGHRADQSQNPTAILRWMLAQVGVKLVSHQIMRDGVRYRVYSLDRASVEKSAHYCRARLAHLAKQRAEKEAQRANTPITQNVDIKNPPAYEQNRAPSILHTIIDDLTTYRDAMLDILAPNTRRVGVFS